MLRELVFDNLQRIHWQIFGKKERETHNIWVVGIDDATIDHLGSWPIRRKYIADLLTLISDYEPGAIGVDIFFPDPSLMPEDDEWLKTALNSAPGVVLGHPMGASPPIDAGAVHFHASVKAPSVFQPSQFTISQTPMASSFGQLDDMAQAHGFIRDDWVEGEILRLWPPLVAYRQHYLPSFPAEILRTALGADGYRIHGNREVAATIEITGRQESKFLALDENGLIRPRFQPPGYIQTIPALDVLQNPSGLPFKKGDIVIVGVTALSIDDTAWTAFGETRGAEVHAQMVGSMLDGVNWWRPPFALWIEYGLAAASALLFAGFATGLAIPGLLALLSVFAPVLLAFNIAVMHWRGLLIDPTPALTALAILFLSYSVMTLLRDRRRRRSMEDENLRLETELKLAQQFQQSILPVPGKAAGLPETIRVDASLTQSNFVGGDFFDFFMIDSKKLFFVAADVSGKGWPGAFVMATAKAHFQSHAFGTAGSVAEIVKCAETEIMRNNPHDLFITAIAGLLDVTTGSLELCNAGHPPPILMPMGQKCVSLETVGAPPIGMVADFRFASSRYSLAQGDRILLFTDGFAELTDKGTGDSMGDLRNFLDAMSLQDDSRMPAARIVEHALSQHSGVKDDITLMTIDYNPLQLAV